MTLKQYKHEWYLKHKKQHNQKSKEYRKTHRNGLVQYSKQYYAVHYNELLEKQKKYNEKNKKKRRQYLEANKDKIQEQSKKYYLKNKLIIRNQTKKYYLENKDKIRKYQNDYCKQRRITDIKYKIKYNLRIRLNKAIRNNTKSASTKELLGCTVEFLKRHLESQFTTDMNWENYGKWHIDHIKSCAKFDLSKLEEQRKCFHYTNLQPLWALDNLKKSDN